MGLKIGQNINFRPFNFLFLWLLGRHTACLVTTQFLGCDTACWTTACFSSPTCQGHNFFVLTRIWACEVSLENSLNVECNHEGI